MQSSITVTTAQYAFWRTRAGVMLAIMRAMQVGMLVFLHCRVHRRARTMLPM